MAIGRDFPGSRAEGAALAGDRPDRLRTRSTIPRRSARTTSSDRDAERRCASADAGPHPADRPGVPARPDASRRFTQACRIDPWFLRQIEEIVAGRGRACARDGLPADRAGRCCDLKKMGFSDARLAELAGMRGSRRRRRAGISLAVRPVFKRIDTCAAEFPSRTPYMYSTYEGNGADAGRVRGRCRATATRSSSSAAARTASARASSSTTAASTPPIALREAGYRDHHGQLQPGDRVDRLRHLRPAVFRAADRRGRDRDGPGRAGEAARCWA